MSRFRMMSSCRCGDEQTSGLTAREERIEKRVDAATSIEKIIDQIALKVGTIQRMIAKDYEKQLKDQGGAAEEIPPDDWFLGIRMPPK